MKKTLEQYERALDKLIEYTHQDGIFGCPYNCDVSIIDEQKNNECMMCDWQYINIIDLSVTELDEYEKKSCKCWKEWCFKND